MKTATVADLRNHFTRLAKWIEEGQPIAITRRGQTFATLSPSKKKKPVAEWPDLANRRASASLQTGRKAKKSDTVDYARGDY